MSNRRHQESSFFPLQMLLIDLRLRSTSRKSRGMLLYTDDDCNLSSPSKNLGGVIFETL